jgi:hypothetical protein
MLLVLLCHKEQEAAICKGLSRSHAPRGNADRGGRWEEVVIGARPPMHSHAERGNEGLMRIHEFRDTVGLAGIQPSVYPHWIPAQKTAGMTGGNLRELQ